MHWLKYIVGFTLLLCCAMTATGDGSPYENVVSGESGSLPQSYVPPLLSNGSLSMLVDYQGCQFPRSYAGMTPSIWWAGRRYGPPNDQLIPFGQFEQELTCNGKTYREPSHWQQTLNTRDALVTCQCDYGGDFSVQTTVFVPLGWDIIAIRKRFLPTNSAAHSVRMELKYDLSRPGGTRTPVKRSLVSSAWNAATPSMDVSYQVDGYRLYEGVASILCDREVTHRVDNRTFALAADVALDAAKPAEITFFILLADSLDGNDYRDRAARLKTLVKTERFAGLLDAHRRQWAAYWDESSVQVPVEHIEKAYCTAQYHLRANATRWSLPVGVFNSHWAGRYFGWDETFCFLGLASSNHLAVSRRVPEFRYAGLAKAVARTSRYFTNTVSYGARYPWETLEDGTEAAPAGFWNDHVFHMSHIALSAWFQYLYSGDREFLGAKGYPIIKECATFFAKHMVYEDGRGGAFLGKCTDLERLGPARLNPFMTSCGAIFTLEAASRAATILGREAGPAAAWKQTADKLKQSLPSDRGEYVPYAGCPERSIAVLAGVFPYPVFDGRSTLQTNAVYAFVKNAGSYGNMYPVGKSISTWYGGWMAAALAAIGDKTEAVNQLSQAATATGCFAECFEIREEKLAMHPWFATAAGNFVYAVNQVLLQSRDDEISIAPAVPQTWKRFSFKLPCYGNLLAAVTVEQGRITTLALVPGDSEKPLHRTLVVPEWLVDRRALKSPAIRRLTARDGCLRLDLDFKGRLALVEAPR
jgi:hypothetical protein